MNTIKFIIYTPKDGNFYRQIEEVGKRLTREIQRMRKYSSDNFEIESIDIKIDDSIHSQYKYPPLILTCRLKDSMEYKLVKNLAEAIELLKLGELFYWDHNSLGDFDFRLYPIDYKDMLLSEFYEDYLDDKINRFAGKK